LNAEIEQALLEDENEKIRWQQGLEAVTEWAENVKRDCEREPECVNFKKTYGV